MLYKTRLTKMSVGSTGMHKSLDFVQSPMFEIQVTKHCFMDRISPHPQATEYEKNLLRQAQQANYSKPLSIQGNC